MSTVKAFKVSSKNFSRLTKSEKQIVPILVEAARVIDKIYLLQQNRINNGANFYPRDAIKSEITTAAQKDPKIFSPYTVVKRDEKGKLIAIDYHIEYKEYLKKANLLLVKAAKLSNNKSFKHYLEAAADALITGKYASADKAWLECQDSNIDIVIGPRERYLDKLFFIKRAYQADVSIIDKENSKKATMFRDILYATVGANIHRVVPPSSTEMVVKESFVFAGFLADAFFTQQHFPTDSDSVERYGSRIIGYESSLNRKYEKLIFPIFSAVFEKKFRQRYSKDLIRRGAFYHVLLNGIVQHMHRYKGSRTRLRELFPILDEANTAASGIQHSKHLLLKGVIDQKELEAIMIARICWMFAEIVISKKTNARDVYLKGDAIIFNFLKKEGAILERDGISWPNFAKMFFEMENLASIFTEILENGTYPDAEKFVTKYLDEEPLREFERRLVAIKPL